MATLVFFHAHPDDEAIITGGSMARAAAEGHRVVLVTATDGAVGEVAAGVLGDGESLQERRRMELEAAGAVLGVDRLELLGYRDSGMMGVPDNEHPRSFWQADAEEAGRRLAAILDEESADVLTIYDDHGIYGHPDHIQVHRVGRVAASLASTPEAFEATVSREHFATVMAAMEAADTELPGDQGEDPEAEPMGSPEHEITTVVDVTPYLATKRAAMECHASQMPTDSWFLALPDHVFELAFGTEWYVRVAPQPHLGTTEPWLLVY